MCRVSDAGRLKTVPRAPAAGVRNPPREETAIEGRRGCGERYGDLRAAADAGERSRGGRARWLRMIARTDWLPARIWRC